MTILLEIIIAQRVEAPLAPVARVAGPERHVCVLGRVDRDGIPNAVFRQALDRADALALDGAETVVRARDVEMNRVAALVQMPFFDAAGVLQGWSVRLVFVAGDDVEVDGVASLGEVGHVDGLDVVDLWQLAGGVAPWRQVEMWSGPVGVFGCKVLSCRDRCDGWTRGAEP